MAFRDLDYQRRVLDTLDLYLLGLTAEKASYDNVAKVAAANPDIPIPLPDFPAKTWERMKAAGLLPPARAEVPYSARVSGDGVSVPNVTIKVPTGGGKTYLATAALSRIFGRYLTRNTGFVLWIVPNDAIYAQTLKHLRDRQHPYRQTLDRAAAGRVLILEKTDALNRADVDANLCVMVLMLQSANRKVKAGLKLFQDRGDVHGFTPPDGEQDRHRDLLKAVPNLSAYTGSGLFPMVHDSLGNALRIMRPIIVMDEGHKAVAAQAFSTLYDFNPCFVLELSATPKGVKAKAATATSAAVPARPPNILVEVTGRELEREGVIKMPLNILPMASDDWKATLRTALDQLNVLDGHAREYRANGGRYIRPILLVQAERTGEDQRDADYIHADHVKAWLLAEGLEEDEIALKTAQVDDLANPENKELASPKCRVRAIVTKAALQEGWDCPFAYVLCSLAASGNEAAMTQLVGRILRQPGAAKTGKEALDECYVVTHRAETNEVVAAIKTGLTKDGLSDLVQDVVIGDPKDPVDRRRTLDRRSDFSQTVIELPRVLWCSDGEAPRLLDAESDIHAQVDWSECDLTAFADSIHPATQAAETQMIRLTTKETAGFDQSGAAWTTAERRFDPAYAVRMLRDFVPNPFVARSMVERVLARLRERNFEEALIGRLSGHIIDELQKTLARWREGEAIRLFRAALADGRIQFRVRDDGANWQMPVRLPTTHDTNAPQLPSTAGGVLGKSIFVPVYSADYNPDEARVAVYLDADDAIRWWHRNGTDRRSYGLRGWRRGHVYPDFLFKADRNANGEWIVALETKGDQLAGNLDTTYKRTLLETLSVAYDAQDDQAPAASLALARSAIGFQAALVEMSAVMQRLPALIHGEADQTATTPVAPGA